MTASIARKSVTVAEYNFPSTAENNSVWMIYSQSNNYTNDGNNLSTTDILYTLWLADKEAQI